MRLLIIAASLLLFCSACQHSDKATRIYINAKVWTGDSSQPATGAVAVKDSIILYVGNAYETYKDGNTEIVDLKGQLLIPGLIDNHTHFLSGGTQLASINLRDAKSREEFCRITAEFAKKLTPGRWIMGGDWDHEAWGGDLPRKEWIDSVTGDHPMMVTRYDGHMVLVNSAVIKLAGITKNTPNPAGGEIVRDPATGEPTGVFKDGAMDMLYAVVPKPTDAQLDEDLQRGIRHAWEHGVTQVNDVGSWGGWIDLTTYRRAYNNGKLGLRVYSFVPVSTWQKLDSLIKKDGRGNDWIRWGAVKGFVDGSLGSTTAWFYQPYLDAKNKTGLQVTDTILLKKWILSADSAGIQVATHAIGDHAIHWLLDVYAEADRRHHGEHRFRIEHTQHLLQEDIPRIAAMQVIPSMQPYHAIDDGRWAFKRLDDARLKGTYAFNSLLKAGAKVTFGSDWTVAPLDPIAGIYAAVTRRTLDNKNPDGWYPEQKLTVEQALQCYTVNNAFAGKHENKTGKLKAGMLADMVVLSDDLFSIAPEKIKDVKVVRTIINGKEVYTGK